MTAASAQTVLDQVMGQVFGYRNILNIEQFMQKYAFDIRLPQQVYDSTTNEPTWTQSVNPSKFITVKNAWAREDWDKVPAREFNTIEEVISAWGDVNYTATERYLDSLNIAESDNVYTSENVYRSQDISSSKNILFSDGVSSSEYIAAGQRSTSSTYCIRIEDSKECSDSFSVAWSKKIVRGFFIQDCSDMYECLFCAHVNSKKYCVANRQLEENDYHRVKDMVIRWILTA
jgi:hypothetical protein